MTEKVESKRFQRRMPDECEHCGWIDPVTVYRSKPLDELRRKAVHRFVVEKGDDDAG